MEFGKIFHGKLWALVILFICTLPPIVLMWYQWYHSHCFMGFAVFYVFFLEICCYHVYKQQFCIFI